MSGIIEDRRKDKRVPIMWAVATDKFMSGWGMAPDKSYIAYPIYVYNSKEHKALMTWMKDRNDFIRVRENVNLPKVRDGCHLSINDAPDWL
jgi:hypothetical protein